MRQCGKDAIDTPLLHCKIQRDLISNVWTCLAWVLHSSFRVVMVGVVGSIKTFNTWTHNQTFLRWVHLVSYRLVIRNKALLQEGSMDLWESVHTHTRFSWSSRVFGCMCRLYCENAIAWNHMNMNWHISLCSLNVYGLLSLPVWPQIRGNVLVLGGPGITHSAWENTTL